ncbi:TonB-dependent receptor [Flavobacterium rhizosphaerae]|uniref:TonB-dependent receptor n=1 Tax=Flavobacterium rhizosphaerae TaxID=3163298 RepID=A0ABW8YYP4_9FLAO
MKNLFHKKYFFLHAPVKKKQQFIYLAAAGLATFTAAAQQPAVQDTTQAETYKLDEVLVQSVRATGNTPVTFTNITKQEIAPRNLGQDIPVLLNYLPSVVTTTDAGNGIGYTGIRIRGADASRINVTINGIPYNDAESHGTYWVNMGDFASSAENIQVQRGVGTSTNGAGAFGASLNVLTDAHKKEASGEISNSFGSFNSRKHTVKFSTGLMNDHFEIAGRLSNIESDGYIDRASSSLKSYFLQGTYINGNTLIKALAFGGKEKTYQAWNGIDQATLEENRRFNTSGIYTDENGNIRYYDNETDNYQQDQYQLHWNQRWGAKWNTNLAVFYTRGKGYYENYMDNIPVDGYPGIQPTSLVDYYGETVPGTDLIRRKWLDNDFYGTTFSANYSGSAVNVILGGGLNQYQGAHYGNVIWALNPGSVRPDDRYYDNDATKTDFNIFAKATYALTNNLSLFGDMQYRGVHYTAGNVLESSDAPIPVDDTFNFFNPKAGLTYTVNNNNNIYFSYGRSNKEPRRSDYENGSTKPESLNDFELGWRYNTAKTAISINGYYMCYKDQLVLTGTIDDVGAPVYANSGDSYRTGIEANASIPLIAGFSIRPNVSVSVNKNIDFYTETEEGAQNEGDTDIAFSPNVIGAVQLVYQNKGWYGMLATKYVGEQYMDNLETADAKLPSYTTTDLNVSYTFKPRSVFKEITVTGLVNNIFDEQYASNGYYYYGAYYYPQAGINFLAGLTLKF